MKNKILPILCIFVILSFIFINNSVFAYEETYNNRTFYVPDQIFNIAKDLPEFEKVGSDYDLIIMQEGWPTMPSLNYYIIFANSGGCLYDTQRFVNTTKREVKFSGTSIVKAYVYDKSFTFLSTTTSINQFTYVVNGSTDILYSTKDVYTDSSLGTLFFRPTPPAETPEIPETTPETVEIPAVETVEQIPVAMVETLKMIIPVGLVVLSVVFVIYLVRQQIYRSL